ncbi:MAG: hypothetical protein ACK5SM_07655, partial [Sphingomonadales bacterium]
GAWHIIDLSGKGLQVFIDVRYWLAFGKCVSNALQCQQIGVLFFEAVACEFGGFVRVNVYDHIDKLNLSDLIS